MTAGSALAVPSAAARWAVLALLLATVLTAFVPRDLWTPDEQRYGEVPREMLRSGDLVVPHLNARPYAEKPPVFFWAVAILSLPSGDVTSFTARLAGCLFAAGAFLLVHRLGRRLADDDRAGAIAAFAFGTSLLLLFNATRATMDLALTFFVLLSIERGFAWLDRGGAGRALVSGVAAAAAVLAKGPLGVLLPAFAIGARALLGPRPPPRSAGWWIAPLALSGGVALWLVPAAVLGGEAYRDRLFGQILSRTSGAEAHHVQGVLYYFPLLAATGLPWTLHGLAGAARAFGPRRAGAPGPGLCALAIAGVLGLVVLSLAATKREVYPIPVLALLALPAGAAVVEARPGRLVRAGKHLLLAAAPVGALLCLALPFLGTKLFVKGEPWPDTLFDGARFLHLLPAFLVFVLGSVWAFRRRGDGTRVALQAGVVLAVGALLVKAAIYPEIDALKSFGNVARAALEASDGREVVVAGPIEDDWLWNLDRPRVSAMADLAALVGRLGRGGRPARRSSSRSGGTRRGSARRRTSARRRNASTRPRASAPSTGPI